MRKLIIVGSYPPPYGGVAIFVKNLTNTLLHQGYKFELLKLTKEISDKDILDLRFPFFWKKIRNITYKSLIIDSGNMFLEYPDDLETIKRGIVWSFYKCIKKHVWVKIFHDGTLPIRYQQFNFLKKIFFRGMLFFIDEIVVVNDEIEHWLESRITKKKIRKISSILPFEKEKVSLLPEVVDFCRQYDRVVCTVGTCAEMYGFLHILEAIRILNETKKFKIGLIAVDGNFATNNKEYVKQCNKIKEYDNTLLIEKGIRHEEMLEIFRRADLFVRGVSKESYGISRIEAILMGTKVLATNVGETKGMETYPFGDIKTLIEKMNLLLYKTDVEIEKLWIKYYENVSNNNYKKILDIIEEYHAY